MPHLRLQLLRTLFRYAFDAAACFSALVFLACLFFWPRSYYRQEGFIYQTPARGWGVGTFSGRLGLAGSDDDFGWGGGLHGISLDRPSPEAWSYASWHTTIRTEPAQVDRGYHYLGLRLTHATRVSAPAPLTHTELNIPFSYLTLLSALLPVLWLRAWRRRRRAQRARGFPVEPPSPSEPRPSGSVSAPPPAR